METRNFSLILAAALAFAPMTGCTDNNPAEKEPVFPENSSVSISLGEVKTLSFIAEADWKISIDKPWLVILDNDNEVSQLNGVAGDVTFQVTTSNVTSIFESETAEISLTMKTKTQPVFNVTRTPEERWAKMWYVPSVSTEEPQAIESLDLEFDEDSFTSLSSTKFTFTANYDWVVESVPEWMLVSPDLFSGVAGEEFNAREINTYAKIKDYSVMPFAQAGKIVVTDRNGENPVEFNATYSGMDENSAVVLNGARPMNSTRGIGFNHDGHVLGNDYDQTPTEETAAVLTAYTKDMDFALMTVEERDPYGMGSYNWFANPTWLQVTVNEDKTLSVSVSANTGAARTAYIVIVPKALQPEDPSSMTQLWFRQNKEKFLPTETAPSNYMIVISQREMPVTGGFVAKWGGSKDIACVPFAEYGGDFAGLKPSELNSALPDDNTYVAELSPDPNNTYGLQVAPLGFDAEWMPYEDGSLDKPLFELKTYSGTWEKENMLEFASVYSGGKTYYGISYKRSAIDAVQANSMAFLLFRKDSTVSMYKPNAALVLIKK
ncbi:MAG: BACON domain-containing protein [Candidatus Cryptobacteroides sp.]